ncbi:MAG: hypothetical protein WC475_04785 [Candidatus Paceibacterota bacterium]
MIEAEKGEALFKALEPIAFIGVTGGGSMKKFYDLKDKIYAHYGIDLHYGLKGLKTEHKLQQLHSIYSSTTNPKIKHEFYLRFLSGYTGEFKPEIAKLSKDFIAYQTNEANLEKYLALAPFRNIRL